MGKNQGTGKDRRREPRRQLSLQVLFALVSSPYHLTNWTPGTIIDASPRGVRIAAAALPELYKTIEIFCPISVNDEFTASNHANNDIFYRMRGQIIWVSRERGEMGVMLT